MSPKEIRNICTKINVKKYNKTYEDLKSISPGAFRLTSFYVEK